MQLFNYEKKKNRSIGRIIVGFDFHFGGSVCYAKHVNDKAAKWAKSKRPRKSRPSDINRKPIVYAIHSFQKPTEFSISDEPAVPMSKPSPAEN